MYLRDLTLALYCLFDVINDLGVIHDRSLNFHAYLETASSKAHRAFGFIARNTKEFTSNETVLHLYKTLVVPHLTYCCKIWSLCFQEKLEILESVQYKFVRNLLYRYSTPMYWHNNYFLPHLERLKLSSIGSLQIFG